VAAGISESQKQQMAIGPKDEAIDARDSMKKVVMIIPINR